MENKNRDDQYFDKENNIYLAPSHHGEQCPGNGKNKKIECCCDECNYFLLCFPDWREHVN